MNALTRPALQFPSNSEAEQSLLGTLLVHNPSYDKVSDFLRAEHFFMPVHGRIYQAIADTIGQGKSCSPVILKNSFADDADLENVGGVAYFADLAASVVTIFNVEDYGRAILDLFQRRQMIEICDDAITQAAKIEPGSNAADLITATEAKLYTAAEGDPVAGQAKVFSTVIGEAIDAAQAAYHRDPGSIGVSSGLIDADKIIGGLRKPDLLILAGRPGMGKSALAMGMAWHVASLKIPVAFFSLEMSAEQLGTRVLASEAGVPSDLIRKGEINRDQFQKFMDASQRLASLPLFIDDTAAQTIAHIRKGIRRIKRQQKGLGLVVVDYLQLIHSYGKDRAENRVQELTQITKALKNLAKEFQVPVLALSQLSRKVEERDDKRPQLADLRESGSIEQDADIVAFIFREEYYAEKDEPTRKKDETQDRYNERYANWNERKAACANRAEFLVAKNRHGATGTAYLHFDGPTTTFSNVAAYYSVAGSM